MLESYEEMRIVQHISGGIFNQPNTSFDETTSGRMNGIWIQIAFKLMGLYRGKF